MIVNRKDPKDMQHTYTCDYVCSLGWRNCNCNGVKQISSLPTVAKDRKTYPIATGCVDYFPDALAEVAHVSFVGNQQHNPGQPLHWDKSKSADEADAQMRHFVQRGTRDTDGIRHSAKAAWRALALLQREIEAERNG